MLDAGAISAVTFATRICDPLENKALAGVRSIAFTKGSKLNADDQLNKLCELNTNAIISIYLLILPIISWLGLNTEGIVNLLFGRGEFDKGMTDMVSLALIGLLPHCCDQGQQPNCIQYILCDQHDNGPRDRGRSRDCLIHCIRSNFLCKSGRSWSSVVTQSFNSYYISGIRDCTRQKAGAVFFNENFDEVTSLHLAITRGILGLKSPDRNIYK